MAVVTDARYRMSVAIIRSLGRAGVKVHCLEGQGTPKGDVLGFKSRYAFRTDFVASPVKDPGAFVRDLLEVCEPGSVVIPVSLASVLALAKFLGPLGGGKVQALTASVDSLLTADDTAALLPVARKIGVPCPKDYTIGEPPKMPSHFPVVIKYRQADKLGFASNERYAIVKDRESFPSTYRVMASNQPDPVVQEYVAGEGYGMSALFDSESQPVGLFCHRRVREFPVSGGPSCFAESVWDPKMVDYGVGLLRELRWKGVAMVEFKGDIGSGNYRLMEINPRFWGSLPLAIASGMDFPLLLYLAAQGQELPKADLRSPGYRLGVKMRFLLQDLLSFPGYLKARPEGRMSFVRGYLKDLFDLSVTDGLFQWDDPSPNLAYVLRALRSVSG